MKQTLDDIRVKSKRVLLRVDFNVPLDAERHITDDSRIRAAMPTIHRLVSDGGRVIVVSHLGRPDEEPQHKQKYSLAPVAARLSELLGKPVRLVRKTVGPEVRSAVQALGDGEVVLLENVRFHSEEVIKDKHAAKDASLRQAKDAFARELADLADVYVNDAFGACHRDNASMLTVPQRMLDRPRVAGYLVRRELEFLGGAVNRPKRPFTCVLGGAKVSDKIKVIESLLGKCDTLLIGGAMMFTFWGAEGYGTGRSKVEPEAFELARRLKGSAGDKLVIPEDCVAAASLESGAATQVCRSNVPAGLMGLDIGPASVTAYVRILASANTVVWNGPMGVFETPPFDAGTRAVARALADATRRDAVTIVGGGDSAAAVTRFGLAPLMSHVSTGGGASLEFLEGKMFPAIEVLQDAD